ncbi:MAG: ferritin-like domain-containing protein [Proteobacteria bacterium]|nr:ferritin-like domain-containing protein [Pseudomonadota bacterium]
MGKWTLDDIPWGEFDRSKLDPGILNLVKAASLVERNGGDYTTYLCSVFHDDPEFQAAARLWGEEEIQHGEALARWAALADPSFDFQRCFQRFAEKIQLPLTAAISVRGSRAGELVARCIVETGTSSYYTALAEASEEPVLQAICRRIAADEFRHYKLFYTHLNRYVATEGLGTWGRIRVALKRLQESEDDELAFAYHTANLGEVPYERRAASRAYAKRAYALYRPHHVERGIGMVLKAVGLVANGRLGRLVSGLAWRFMRHRARQLATV